MSSNILVIDDSSLIREQIIRIVTETALFDNCREATDGLEGYKALLNFKPDLVICDLELPRMGGFKFLQMVNSSEELLDIPIIILTNSLDQDSKRRGLELGACDYIAKPFDAAELVARTKVHLKIKKLQDEQRRTFKLKGTIGHLRTLSNIDSLTNLCNRRFLMEILEAELQRARRLRTFFSLIVLDVDNFKNINDIYGHQNGDRVLVAVAEILHGVLRRYDFASRYGGDEFVLLLPSVPNSGAVEVAERILAAVQSLTLPAPMAHLPVTASLGVSTYPAPQIDSVSTLFHVADCALYQAKRNGRNRVETMTPA
jgi:two-component system, cell cycle response regulator